MKKNILSLLFGFWLGTFALGLYAENYYVDAENGSDANVGTSPEAAWQTAQRVSLFDGLQPGDVVHFRAGCVWRESLGIQSGKPGKPITYTRYGEGAKPSFWSSVNLCNEKLWQREPQDNIWRTIPDQVEETVRELPWFAAGRWSLHQDGAGQATLTQEKTSEDRTLLKIQCAKSGETASNIQLNNASFSLEANVCIRFRFRARSSVPFSMKHVKLMQAGKPWGTRGWTISKLEPLTTQWQEYEILFITLLTSNQADGRLSFFLGGEIPEGCLLEIEPLGAQEVRLSSASLLYEVGNIVLRQEKTGKEEFAAWKRWSVETLKKQADFFYDRETRVLYFYSTENPAKIYSQMEAAMKRYTFGVSGHQYFVLDGLESRYSSGHGAAGANIRHGVIRNCDFCWTGGSWLFDHPQHGPVRFGNGVELWDGCEDMLVEHCYFFQIYDTATTNQGPGNTPSRDIFWRHNRMERCEQAYEIWNTSPQAQLRNIHFEYNECVDSGFGWSHEQRGDKTGTHILAYRMNNAVLDVHYEYNTFRNARDAMFWYFNPRLPEVHIDNNTYFVPEKDGDTARKMFRWGDGRNGTQVSYQEYRKMLGKDSHSTWNNGE